MIRNLASAVVFPRFIAYVDDFPRTPSRKIKKRVLIEETDDLRAGSYDRRAGGWL